MAGCLDDVRMPNLEIFECGEKRNKLASITSGLLFSIGWWIAIDAAVMYPSKTDLKDVFHICGVFSTISMFMINAVSTGQLRGEAYTDGCLGERGAKVWFFVGCLMGFGSFIAACYILIGEYMVTNPTFKPNYQYPGVAMFLQNAFILGSSLVYKFGRSEELWA